MVFVLIPARVVSEGWRPMYIWGPPAWGYYPPLYYPAFGFGWGPMVAAVATVSVVAGATVVEAGDASED